MNQPPRGLQARIHESGKVGLAVLMWLFGVPGVFVLLYMIFG